MTEADYIFGLHAVAAALERSTGGVEEIWAAQGRNDKRMAQLLALAESRGVAVHRVSREALDLRVPGVRHQGVVARTRLPAAGSEDSLDHLLRLHPQDLLLLMLDGVQDPHNLGACLRTADAAGVHGVVVPRDRAAGLTSTVRKVASGAAESVPFIQVTNLARTLRQLQDANVRVVGTAGEATLSLYQMDWRGPVALVMGGEGKGMRRLTREHCGQLVAIPMAGTVASLNISVAAGICLYEIVRQRQG